MKYTIVDGRFSDEWVLEGTLEDVVRYLGEGYEECEDAFDCNELLKKEGQGNATYKVLPMEYVVIDSVGSDEWKEYFLTEKDALEYAEEEWNHLSTSDKNRRTSYTVVQVEDTEYEEVLNTIKEF